MDSNVSLTPAQDTIDVTRIRVMEDFMNIDTQTVKQPTHTQGVLFATLPRQLPILKSGPEDEPSFIKAKGSYPLADSLAAIAARAATALRIH